ncbi:hypothetical protein [Vibrio sp. RW]|nr:hypothetical protein [Vibrio sp. RW]
MTEYEEKMLEESKKQSEHLETIKYLVGGLWVFVIAVSVTVLFVV